jgi:hypothetical protein
MSASSNDPDPFPTAARPVPARVVVQLDPVTFGTDVPAGTRVSADGATAEFRTAIAAVLPPVTLAGIGWRPAEDHAVERLRVTLAGVVPLRDVELRLPPRVDTDGSPHGLRLFLDGASAYRALTLAPVRAEVVCGDWSALVSDDAVRPGGFDLSEALLPPDPREPEAVRLLAEWAVCPEKFLFVDLLGLRPALFPPAATEVHVDLLLNAAASAALGDAVPVMRLGCVAAVNRRVVELPPVPLLRGEVRLDADPLSGDGDQRMVLDVLGVRAVLAGQTVRSYAERLAPLPPPLAARPARVGRWSLRRDGDRSWLCLDDREPVGRGRTLFVTAACCRRSLPAEPMGFAAGVGPVAPVRPPLRPAAAGDLRTADVDRTLASLIATFAGPAVDVRTATVACGIRRPTGIIHGVQVRLSMSSSALSADDLYLLARVLDHAVATAGPAIGFTRVVAVTAAGDLLADCPPRAGKDPVDGTVVPLPDRHDGRDTSDHRPPSGPAHKGRRRVRSVDQATSVAAGFAAVARPASVTGLAGVLRHLLGVPVRVLPFSPAGTAVDPPSQLRLGGGGHVLGQRRPAWSVRVVIGPLDRRTFDRFAPGTRATRRVQQLLSAAVGPGATIQPLLRADQVVPWALGRGRLGRSLWLGRHTGDFDGLVLDRAASAE